MTTLTIFVSSPGDVQNERLIVGKVIERLQAKFWSFVRLELVLWEKKALRATAHFQEELVRPSQCDIVLGLLWHRLGTPLPAQFQKADGARFESGTEWEIVEAFEGFEKSLAQLGPQKAKPDILIYRRLDPREPHHDPKQEALAAEQEKKAAQFFNHYFLNPDGTNARSFSPYHQESEFEDNLTAHLTDLILKRIPTLTRDYTPPPINGNPFLGLSHFDFHHNDRFFGRNRAIREVLAKLKEQDTKGHPFVLIYGASGYGKSSLMRAGVAPRLTHPDYLDDIPLWRRALITPSLSDGNPVESLARAILTPSDPHPDTPKNSPALGLPELASQTTSIPDSPEKYDLASLPRLLSNPDQLPFVLADLVTSLDTLSPNKKGTKQNRGPSLLLQIDQFEEIFTSEKITHHDRQTFFALLNALSRTRRIWIIATMRSEYFPRIANYPALRSLVQSGGQYILEAPDDKELFEIIRYPALAARLSFENHPQKHNRDLSDDIYQAAQKQPDSLPLLEFTLDELYQLHDPESQNRTLTYDHYQQIGGLEGAIATHAEAAFKTLKEHQQGAHPHIFAKLVRVSSSGGSTPTKSRANLQALQDSHPGAPAFIEKFAKENLLVTDHDLTTNQTTVTLAHEALLTQWPLFKNWIDEHRPNLRAETRLQEQTKLWLEAKKTNPKKAKGLLLTEARLAEALDLQESNLFDLDQNTHTYIQQSRKKAKRKTRILQATAIAFAFLAAGAGFLGYLSNRNAIVADTEKQNAINAHNNTNLETSKSDATIAMILNARGETPLAMAHVARALDKNSNNKLAFNQAWRFLTDGYLFPPEYVTKISDPISTIVFSPSEKYCAFGTETGHVIIIDISTYNILKFSTKLVGNIQTIAFSPNENQVAIGAGNRSEGFLSVWDFKHEALPNAVSTNFAFDSLSLRWPLPNLIISQSGRSWGSGFGVLQVLEYNKGWNLVSGFGDIDGLLEEKSQFKKLRKFIKMPVLSSWILEKQRLLAIQDYSKNELNFYELSTDLDQLVPGKTIELPEESELFFSEESGLFVQCSPEKQYFHLIDIENRYQTKRINLKEGERIADISQDGKKILIHKGDEALILSMSNFEVLRSRTFSKSSRIWSPDGAHLAFFNESTHGQNEKSIKLESISDLSAPKTLFLPEKLKRALFSPASQLFLAADVAGWVRIWDVQKLERSQLSINSIENRLDLISEKQNQFELIHDEKTNAILKKYMANEKLSKLEKVITLEKIKLDKEWISGIAISEIQNRIVCTYGETSTRPDNSSPSLAIIYDLTTGRLLCKNSLHPDDAFCPRFSPDGSFFITVADDRHLRKWSTSSGLMIGKPLALAEWARSFEMSHTGHHLITPSGMIIDIEEWSIKSKCKFEQDFGFGHARFSQDDSLLTTVSIKSGSSPLDRGNILLNQWDCASGRIIGNSIVIPIYEKLPVPVVWSSKSKGDVVIGDLVWRYDVSDHTQKLIPFLRYGSPLTLEDGIRINQQCNTHYLDLDRFRSEFSYSKLPTMR